MGTPAVRILPSLDQASLLQAVQNPARPILCLAHTLPEFGLAQVILDQE